MVEIRGFKALRFDATITGSLNNVLTPPYDVIGEAERDRLAKSGPYNMTHLILPVAHGEQPPYARAAALLAQWVACGALRADKEEHIYLLRLRFTGPDGIKRERKSFLARLKLPEKEERFILGHERTFDKPVEDRLALLRATKANLEPIFLMYSDPDGQLAPDLFGQMTHKAPLLSATTADGVEQELWAAMLPEAAQRHLEGQTLYIADGHHRFKTACAYRDEQRAQAMPMDKSLPHDYVMAGFVAFEEPGLKIHAAHRVLPATFGVNLDALLARLETYFNCTPLPKGDAMLESLEEEDDRCAMIMYSARGAWRLVLREDQRDALLGRDRAEAWRNLDVAVLHRGILGNLLNTPDTLDLLYENDASEAMARVDAGTAVLAFLLRATRAEQVRACAEAFEPMPQKSTYFFPKLPSGAAIYSHLSH